MGFVHSVPKKDQNQDIESRLRELTERTRRTRRELEELIHRSDADSARGFSHDKGQPSSQLFFRRRRAKYDKKGE
jgi:hypothetical protein